MIADPVAPVALLTPVMAYSLQDPETGVETAMDGLPMTPAADGARMPFRYVTDHVIPADHRSYVRHQVVRLAAELGLGPVRVRWFAPTAGSGDFSATAPFGDAALLGMAMHNPPTIALLATLRGDAVESTIRHEMRHLTQPRPMTRPDRERDAARFAQARTVPDDRIEAAGMPTDPLYRQSRAS